MLSLRLPGSSLWHWTFHFPDCCCRGTLELRIAEGTTQILTR